MTSIDLAKLDHVHGGGARVPSGGLGSLQGLGGLQMQQLSTDRTRFQPAGASYHMEYPNGFKANGNANSWQSVDNATGNVIQRGDNP